MLGFFMEEAGKLVLEKGLELGQAAAEDYVKDFFKDALHGELGAKPEVAKKAVGEALKAFLGLVVEELEDCEVSPAEIRNWYEKPLMAFVKDEAVKPILGGAFERECRSIDAVVLERVWGRSEFKKKPFPSIPDGFDWERIGKEYLKKVRKIVRSSEELRSLLQTELLESIVNQQVSPGFEVGKYRESLRCSYGVLKLSTIDSTDQQYRMRLWNVFVEQTVREALPPSRYEVPIDVRRELGMTGELDGEALEGYRRDYLQQPARKVLEAIGGSPLAPLGKGGTGVGEERREEGCHSVILGDPGAGKSTVLQYLAIEWVEGRSTVLPLLIELREYALWGGAGFLEFLHGGRGADWCFDRVKLDEYLREFPTLVMLDGLDEVFDRSMQATIVDEMIRFSHQYPKVRILVTSRIVGYNPDRLQNAGFRHFTIQSLETAEIHEFIDKWYDLAMPGENDRDRLKQRLKDAIANSKAIGNLADNLLLLTMMVILNRRQELPRDRSELYEQATRVLLHHWDVDHKLLQLKEESIGRREKQAMLRAVAYEMQTSDAGLKGNLITADRLTQVLTGYLREQGFEAPREKANGLIEQLRSRNWILCDRGADTYGFVHRTFLEYFCAMEIVHRFEKVRSLSFEQLRDEVFGQHWQDETWHEVLRLICGAIDPKLATYLIEFLIELAFSFVKSQHSKDKESLVFAEFFAEIKDAHYSKYLSNKTKEALKSIVEIENAGLIANRAVKKIADIWMEEEGTFYWIKTISVESHSHLVRYAAIQKLAQFWRKSPTVLETIKSQAENDHEWPVRYAALQALVIFWKNSESEILWAKERANQEEEGQVRFVVPWELSREFKDDYLVFNWIRDWSLQYKNCNGLSGIMKEVVSHWKSSYLIFDWLYDITLQEQWETWICKENPRLTSLRYLAKSYPTHPKTIELLHDRAINDPDEPLREWAIEQLKKLEGID